jgi:3-hydroxybutyrate dehydrogenase
MEMPNVKSLDGKVAMITGAASGIGYAIAKFYAQQGCRLIVTDLDFGAARRAANDFSETAPSLPIRMDVANEADVETGVEQALSQFGRIDILVSNAGIQAIHPVHEFPFSEWKRMLAIHLDGAFLTTKACLKPMYRQNGGSIIYMGSVHSYEASPLKAAYVAAKHGLVGLMRTVAKEGAKNNVRANVICPGFVRTPLVDEQIPKQAKELGISEERVVREVMLRETVDHKFTTVDDVAQVALTMASFPTNALTGQSVVVSHGWHML